MWQTAGLTLMLHCIKCKSMPASSQKQKISTWVFLALPPLPPSKGAQNWKQASKWKENSPHTPYPFKQIKEKVCYFMQNFMHQWVNQRECHNLIENIISFELGSLDKLRKIWDWSLQKIINILKSNIWFIFICVYMCLFSYFCEKKVFTILSDNTA